MQHGTMLWSDKKKGSRDMSEDEVFGSDHLPQVPVMPIADSSHRHRVTFRSLVMRPRLVSSTPCLVPQQVSFDLSQIPETKTSGNDIDSKAEGRPNVGD